MSPASAFRRPKAYVEAIDALDVIGHRPRPITLLDRSLIARARLASTRGGDSNRGKMILSKLIRPDDGEMLRLPRHPLQVQKACR
jgi:hypothetical protein